jgi:mannose-6-phosphate isomerase-like protein (cupin superfamily)
MIRKASEMKSEVREKMRGGAGAVTIRHYIQKEEFKAPVRLCSHLLLPPGAGIGPHPHEKEDEVFIITKGTGLLHDGEKEVRVSAGDAILTGNGGSHAIRNDGREDLEIEAIIVCYPA